MGKNKREVDICTDAGVKFGLGSWAAVIARVDGRGGIVEGSGLFRAGELDSFAAEARAIANGLHLAKRAGIIERGDRVVVRCDHTEVVRRFSGEPVNRPLRDDVREAREVVRKLAASMGCRLSFKHIKGHRNLACGEFLTLLNARADFLCCRALETKRKNSAGVGVSDEQFAALSETLKRRASLSSVRSTVARLTGAA